MPCGACMHNRKAACPKRRQGQTQRLTQRLQRCQKRLLAQHPFAKCHRAQYAPCSPIAPPFTPCTRLRARFQPFYPIPVALVLPAFVLPACNGCARAHARPQRWYWRRAAPTRRLRLLLRLLRLLRRHRKRRQPRLHPLLPRMCLMMRPRPHWPSWRRLPAFHPR